MTNTIPSFSLATPKGFRLHLGIFGRRNAGKSSLLNALTRQQAALVSATAGTTTDPVEKPMEMLPIGPVLFIDTAGIDDVGSLGKLRVEKTRQVFDRTEVGLLVLDLADPSGMPWGPAEDQIYHELVQRRIPILVVLNKGDLCSPEPALLALLEQRGLTCVVTAGLQREAVDSSPDPDGIARLKEAIVQILPDEFLSPPPVVSDLVLPGETVVLVIPIDKEAPKGRIILPQVQTLRDLLDGDQMALVVQDNRLEQALNQFKSPPALVVTDSQAFKKVAAIVPPAIPLTSFSILFARQKGDLAALVAGARAMNSLSSNARILIAESCSHHPIADDIGTVKIPNWLRSSLGPDLTIKNIHGHDFPDVTELAQWDLVIHCGACTTNRKEILTRIARCHAAGVPMTNYGLAIANMTGILDRAMAPLERRRARS